VLAVILNVHVLTWSTILCTCPLPICPTTCATVMLTTRCILYLAQSPMLKVQDADTQAGPHHRRPSTVTKPFDAMRQGGGGLADVRKHTDLRPGAPVPPGFSGWPRLDGRCLSAPEADYDDAVNQLQAFQVRHAKALRNAVGIPNSLNITSDKVASASFHPLMTWSARLQLAGTTTDVRTHYGLLLTEVQTDLHLNGDVCVASSELEGCKI